MATELIAYLGRFHPLVVHFPIALLLVTLFLEIYARAIGRLKLCDTAPVLLMLAGLSAIIAVALGWLLAEDSEYDAATLFWHRLFGLSTALATLLSIYLQHHYRRNGGALARLGYFSGLSIAILAMIVAAHLGGTMAHGAAYLQLPAQLAAWFNNNSNDNPASTLASQGESLFATQIQPVFDKYCFSCHGANKQKGELRLDVRARALTGGRSDLPAILPGKPLQSEIVRRLTLPVADKKAMPPAGKPRPSSDQILTLIGWIHRGAPWGADAVLGPAPLLVDKLKKGVMPASEQALVALSSTGAYVAMLAAGNPLVNVDLRYVAPEQMSDALVALGQLSNHVTWLSLADTMLSDEVLTLLPSLHLLTRLNLAGTSADGRVLERVKKLSHLESLNLYATRINDQDLTQLHKLNNLKSVYLWRTQVSEEGVSALREARPDLAIHLGIQLDIQLGIQLGIQQ